MIDEKTEVIGNVVGTILTLIVLGIISLYLQGCTLKFDNPFYSPSTLDVNKTTSTGGNNYVKVK